MKKHLTIVAILMILIALALPSNQVTGASDYYYCDYAWLDCTNKQIDDKNSCLVITPDDFTGCTQHAFQIFNGCMTAWGCPTNWEFYKRVRPPGN